MTERETKNSVSCAVCGLKIVDDNRIFCSRHQEAQDKIQRAYEVWRAAYGRMAKRDFLERISVLAETGDRVREIAQFLMKNSEGWK